MRISNLSPPHNRKRQIHMTVKHERNNGRYVLSNLFRTSYALRNGDAASDTSGGEFCAVCGRLTRGSSRIETALKADGEWRSFSLAWAPGPMKEMATASSLNTDLLCAVLLSLHSLSDFFPNRLVSVQGKRVGHRSRSLWLGRGHTTMVRGDQSGEQL